MTIFLDKNAVAFRLGVKPKTAAKLMMEMNPVAISGKTRKRYRVTEDSLERWAEGKMMKPHSTGSISKGTKKRMERR